MEKQLIDLQPLKILYNDSPFSRLEKNKPLLGQQIRMDEKNSSTICKAEKATNIPKTTIIRPLNNRNYLNFSYPNPERVAKTTPASRLLLAKQGQKGY